MQQAVCVRRKKRKKNPKKSTPPKTHHGIHGNPATTTTSGWRATGRVNHYSPASIDPGFVEIDLVQLLQSVKATNVTHTYINRQTHHRQTDRVIIKLETRFARIMAPCTHPGMKRLFCPIAKKRPQYEYVSLRFFCLFWIISLRTSTLNQNAKYVDTGRP